MFWLKVAGQQQFAQYIIISWRCSIAGGLENHRPLVGKSFKSPGESDDSDGDDIADDNSSYTN